MTAHGRPLRLVCCSDTHDRHARVDLPDGDFLLHAGDLTGHGGLDQIREFGAWLGRQPHRHKVVVAGNHDFGFERPTEAEAARRALGDACVYLQDQEATLEGLRIWGSPWQPAFLDWAFNLPRGAPLRAKWDLIPPGIHVLITHGPPLGHGDRVRRGETVGCADLLDAVRRVRPLVHVFGHIHEGHGVTRAEGTTFVNAAICDVRYRPVNLPIVLDVDVGTGEVTSPPRP